MFNLKVGEPMCAPCRAGTFAFSKARSYGVYKDALARAILLLKFEQILPLANYFATLLAEYLSQDRLGFEADVVVAVPLHRLRKKERGYNQAEFIAKPLAKRLGLPCKALLVRERARPDKHSMTFEERWESVRGAFAPHQGTQVDNLRVLLVDDVMTTGATLNACAKVLLRAGAKSVVGLTVARAVKM
jgi:ComF family protein